MSTFHSFVLVENKPINPELHNFLELMDKIEDGTNLSKNHKVLCHINKLPQSWNLFANNVKHQQGKLNLDQCLNSIRLEEQHDQGLWAKG